MNNKFVQKKNLAVGVILTLLCGAIGLFYASILAGIVMTIIGVMLVIGYLVFNLLYFGDFVVEFAFNPENPYYIVFMFLIVFHGIGCVVWAVLSIDKQNRTVMQLSDDGIGK